MTISSPTPGTLRITRGLPASGKTGWALRELTRNHHTDGAKPVVRLNRDDLRGMIAGPGYSTPVHDVETIVTAVQHGPIVELLRKGHDVIVDDTNLRAKTVRTLLDFAALVDAPVELVDHFLDVPVDECVRRDAARSRPVGEAVIRGMATRYLRGGKLPRLTDTPTAAGRPYAARPGTPRAIIVDIDGTVALHHGRSPYDTSRYLEDTPHQPVVEQVRMAADAGLAVLFTSGRDERFRKVTVEWLCRHVTTGRMVWDLFMRPAEDTRNDAVVKLELFDRHIRDPAKR